jgi:hypothetical protein
MTTETPEADQTIVTSFFIKENDLLEIDMHAPDYAFKPLRLKIEYNHGNSNQNIDCEILKITTKTIPLSIGQGISFFKHPQDIKHWYVFNILTLQIKNFSDEIYHLKFTMDGYLCATAYIGDQDCPPKI